ncbi:MAG: cysteine--tRNA ligase, partial [Tissierellia bacterium]|nr:cysteine--tRNA ligase [Tissierellia bacterium]
SYRYFILNSHYRKQLAFSFDSLKSAENAYFKLKSRIKAINQNKENQQISDNVNKYKIDFKECLEDDLNTANAITVLYDILKDDDLNNNEKIYLAEDFDRVLSLDLLKFKEDKNDDVHEDEVKYIEEMILKRQNAKKEKNFQLADSIRAQLLENGIALEDTRQGVNWKKIK